MINTIIFDFGNIFINLDKETATQEFKKLGLKEWNTDLEKLNQKFEKGKINEETFLKGIQQQIPDASTETIKNAWNKLLSDFPLYRLEFLEKLSKKYDLFLLSNTDSIHIDAFEQKVGQTFFRDFYQCFKKVYFSFEIGMRKPESEIFNYIIQKHELSPKRTLFVDDNKNNTDMAKTLGLQVWNLQVGEEDVVHLFDKKIILL